MSKIHSDSDQIQHVPPKPVQGESQAVEHDAVFGDITEEGPNYRNVRDISGNCCDTMLMGLGWMAGHRCSHAEDTIRPRRAIDSGRPEYIGNHPRHHLHLHNLRHYYVVELHDRLLQAEAQGGLWHS